MHDTQPLPEADDDSRFEPDALGKSYLTFNISYYTSELPAWEASRTLRGITHLYYCVLLSQNENYTTRLNTVFVDNGHMLPEDLTKRLNIREQDQLFLSVESLSPSLRGWVYSRDRNAVRNVSDAIQEAKRIRQEVLSKPDNLKLQQIKESKEIQEKILTPIQNSTLDEQVKNRLQAIAVFACLSLLAETIESLETGLAENIA
jgi:hypothetical protein